LKRNKLTPRLILAAILAATGAGVFAGAGADSFVPSGDLPAMTTALAAKSPLLAVTKAGERLVAAGLRGMIVYSDDQGKTWKQAQVPVSNDLVALSFPSSQQGWAVGHGGIVLHTGDGGATWVKQLDGAKASQLAIASLEPRAGADPAVARLLSDEQGLLEEGSGTQPFLDVHFENDQVGYVVGTFNRIFRTGDGGATWQPQMDLTDNPNALHFNSITGNGQGVLYLAGEQGMVWRMDAATKRFLKVPTPYTGTLFGVLADGPVLLTYGMRGSLYRSEDEGKNWVRVELNSLASITGITILPDRQAIALVTQAGTLYVSHDQGKSFAPVKPAAPMNYYNVYAAGQGRIVLSGAEGVRMETLQ